MIEEPPARSLFLIVSHAPQRAAADDPLPLPATSPAAARRRGLQPAVNAPGPPWTEPTPSGAPRDRARRRLGSAGARHARRRADGRHRRGLGAARRAAAPSTETGPTLAESLSRRDAEEDFDLALDTLQRWLARAPARRGQRLGLLALRRWWRYVRRSPARRARSTSTTSTAGPSSSRCSSDLAEAVRSGRREPPQGLRLDRRTAMAEKFYITTAISYPNGAPHIGHAYEVVATDAIARFKRIDGYDVFFMTGTDEHGLKIQQTAATSGTTRKSFVDEMAPQFRAMADALNVLLRPFHPHHRADHLPSTQELWRRMEESGDIYLSQICRLVLGPRRGLLRRERTDANAGRHLRSAPTGHAGRVDRGGELLLPPLRLPGPAARALRGASRLHRPRDAAQRDRQLRALRAAGPLDQPHDLQLGPSRARAIRSTSCMSGSTRSTTTSRRCGFPDEHDAALALLAGRRAHHRQGHRPLPHGLLAGVPDVRGCRFPSASSGTASCSTAARRCRSRSATSSTRSRWPTPTASTSCATSSCAKCRSARTATIRTRRSSIASTRTSRTTSATWRSARCR